MGNVSAKKFQESAKKFPEEIKTKDKDIAAAYDQARRRRTGGDQSEAAVSNQSYKNDFAKSLINQGKFTPDPLKQDIYKDILDREFYIIPLLIINVYNGVFFNEFSKY